ncbi:DUF1761 domain-containing protein [Tenacibaculum sp. IB213877]|uniref:DUF1761 domain-containing protein n=1 Tax=Tenacibaculum sp. IB213877 TaxID=3097351 RepID=UPI002A5B0999|nr:DUF1761 domain-containing protein [Tenacibaculum sp. IB213877]MDY0780570.1 DUF1761 domain-containing protein [Tenacibaculum sp. IB213877]
MDINFLVCALAALVPLVTGFIWYGSLFKNAWMKEMNLTEESMKGANMPLIFGLTYVFSFLITLGLMPVVIHQWGVFSTLAGEPGFMEKSGEVWNYFTDFMSNYGDRFRTFKHGALHGALIGFFVSFPILGIQALFERKNFKYIAINAGYWIITLAIMGGILCQWL